MCVTISNRSVSLIVTRTGRQVSVFAEKLIHRPMSMTCVGKPDIWWHPLTQAGSTASALPLHDIKYYSSCDVNKFPVKSFPLIISVKFIILFETFENYCCFEFTIHKYWPKLCNLFPLDFFANILQIIHHISLSILLLISLHSFFLLIYNTCLKIYLFIISISWRSNNYSQIPFLLFHETIQQEILPKSTLVPPSTKISPKSFYSPPWIINNPRCSPRRWSAEARHLETRFETISAILRPVAIPRKRNS